MRRQKTSATKTALLIYCTQEEAEQIRSAAKFERRTISGFVINAVMTRLAVEKRLMTAREQRKNLGPQP